MTFATWTATEPSQSPEAALVDVVRMLAEVRSVEEIVEIVRHGARQVVGADGATFVLREGDQCHYVDEDAIEPLWRGRRFALTECVSGWAMLHGQAVRIADIYVDERVPQDAYRSTFVRSLAITPVPAADPFAAIGVYWAERHEVSDHEADLLQALADTTSVAFENVRAVNDLERRVVERTAAVQASNRDLAMFAHVAAHDLKDPLTIIVGHAEMLLTSEGSSLTPQGQVQLEHVLRAGHRMAALVDDLLSYAADTDVQPEFTECDANAMVRDVLTDLGPVLEQGGVRVHVAELPKAWGVRPLLERVVHNLITNALRYGDPAGPRIWVTGAADEDEIRLVVADNGPGVPPEDRDRIFRMFERASSDTEGHGIGLAFARQVIDRHGGAITVDEAPEGGAAFTVHLPHPG